MAGATTEDAAKTAASTKEDPGRKNISLTYEMLEESARFLLEKSGHRPRTGIICGTGMGSLASQLGSSDEIPYQDIPNFPVSTVKEHAGKMVLGLLAGIPVMCMQGRVHAYEGYPLWQCAMPVRVMKLMGIEQVIITNAAGGLKDNFSVGDIMIIKDHINMQNFGGDSPLRGLNDERFGPRFPNMDNSYDRDLRKTALREAHLLGMGGVVKEGVYVMMGGPMFETVAELKLLKLMGVDAVGMSTVHEVVVARHCGLKVFAFSLITNKCRLEYDTDGGACQEEVIQCCNNRKEELQRFVKRMVIKMTETGNKNKMGATSH